MCYCGCPGENSRGECKLSKNFLCDEEYTEDDDCREPDDDYVSDQEVSDAEDRYFG